MIIHRLLLRPGTCARAGARAGASGGAGGPLASMNPPKNYDFLQKSCDFSQNITNS